MSKYLYNIDDRCLAKVTFGSSTALKRQSASGSLIKENGMVLVATAAHCLYNAYKKYYYENVLFSLSAENYCKKYRLSKVFIHKKWIEQAALECDTAFAVLDERDFDNKGYLNYALEPRFNLNYGLEYSIKGLTSPKFFVGDKSTTIIGKAIQHDKYSKIIQGIKCKNKNGMSGGPWLTIHDGKIVQNSVSSFSFKNHDDILWGPFWGDTIRDLLHIACGLHKNSPDVIIKEY